MGLLVDNSKSKRTTTVNKECHMDLQETCIKYPNA